MGKVGLLLVVLVALSGHCAAAATQRKLLVWLCLERCDYTPEQSIAHVHELASHVPQHTIASPERWQLAPGSTLRYDNLYDVLPLLKQASIETWPMVCSVRMSDMREAFAKPQPLIDALVKVAKEEGVQGFNIDFEPDPDNATLDDGSKYAAFIHVVAEALKKEGLGLSVDIATWSHLWNFEALAAAAPSRYCLMSSYVYNHTLFEELLKYAASHVPGPMLGMGLDCENNKYYGVEELQSRLDAATSYGIVEVEIWDAPLPSIWWEPLTKWLLAGD